MPERYHICESLPEVGVKVLQIIHVAEDDDSRVPTVEVNDWDIATIFRCQQQYERGQMLLQELLRAQEREARGGAE